MPLHHSSNGGGIKKVSSDLQVVMVLNGFDIQTMLNFIYKLNILHVKFHKIYSNEASL